MLTRLKVKGFKNLLDVDIRFGPFTCIAGLNGVGKSNIFDAIRFLNLLTRYPIMEAAQLLRESKGRSPEAGSLFTNFAGHQAKEMRFVAEMIVERSVQDDFGTSANAAISTLNYEVAFRLDQSTGIDRLELTREELKPIRIGDARRDLGFDANEKFVGSALTGVRRGGPFISTSADGGEITVHQEGHGGRKVPAPKSSRTVTGGTTTSDFPTVLAAHREMSSWRTLSLEPSAMRAPSLYHDDKVIDARGSNLPAAIWRLSKSLRGSDAIYAELANRLAELIDDVGELRIRDDSKTETLTLEVKGQDKVFYPARSLSDGTLRFLVLATLGLDPDVKGIICLEEPENGIHPERVANIVTLLKDIAVDPGFAVGQDNPLRQVMVNTHSPVVIKEINRNDLVYVESERIVQGRSTGRIAVTSIPARSWRAKLDRAASRVAPGSLRAYLGTDEQMLLEFAGEGDGSA